MTDIFALRVPARLDRGIFEALIRNVDPDKRERIRRFAREEDRIRGLFGDLLVRSVIMEKTGLKNEEISFASNSFGKPYLKGRQGLHFNISHSGIWAVAAFDDHPIGVDVQEMESVDMGIARNFFSEDEYRDLLDSEDQISYFFDLWTLKESYIKILGKGLSEPLDAFSIRFNGKEKIYVSADGEPREDIYFAQYNLHRDYKLGVCATHKMLPGDVVIKSAYRLFN